MTLHLKDLQSRVNLLGQKEGHEEAGLVTKLVSDLDGTLPRQRAYKGEDLPG